MPALSTLFDDFSTYDTARWSQSSSNTSVVSGRARIPCTSDGAGNQVYEGLMTDFLYTLDGSSVHLQVPTVPAGGVSTGSYALALTVLAAFDGNMLGVIYFPDSGNWGFRSTTAYADPSEVFLARDATAHQYLRIRIASNTVFWETSPDAVTWTERRNLSPVPAWATGTSLALRVEAARNSGANDFIEVDNVNLPNSTAQPVRRNFARPRAALF